MKNGQYPKCNSSDTINVCYNGEIGGSFRVDLLTSFSVDLNHCQVAGSPEKLDQSYTASTLSSYENAPTSGAFF